MKRVYDAVIEEGSIRIPKEVFYQLKMDDYEQIQIVLSNDCFIVLKKSIFEEYLKKQKN